MAVTPAARPRAQRSEALTGTPELLKHTIGTANDTNVAEKAVGADIPPAFWPH